MEPARHSHELYDDKKARRNKGDIFCPLVYSSWTRQDEKNSWQSYLVAKKASWMHCAYSQRALSGLRIVVLSPEIGKNILRKSLCLGKTRDSHPLWTVCQRTRVKSIIRQTYCLSRELPTWSPNPWSCQIPKEAVRFSLQSEHSTCLRVLA